MSGVGDGGEILAWLREQTGEMTELLERLARAESPSDDPAAQAEAFSILAGELSGLGFTVEALANETTGDTLVARWGDAVAAGDGSGGGADDSPGPVGGVGYQLLLGHLDTVWPLGTLEQMPVELRDGSLFGPGVFDMKGGLVQGLFALRALAEFGRAPSAPPLFLVNADEEISSRESRVHVARFAEDAARAFVLEPSFGPLGKLKTARKGVGRFTVRVKGVASHAGLDPEAGRSAILEVSHQIQTLFALNDPDRGITVNVGTIDGGLRPNVVAPEVVAEVETRVVTAADASRLEESIRSLEPVTEGVSLEVEGAFARPPLERTGRNRTLWEQARAAAGDLGIEIDEALVGGASDGNIASSYTATLDGLGPVGDGAHASHEHVVVEHMPERAALLALLLEAPLEEGAQ